MQPRRKPKVATVCQVSDLTPNMRRIVFESPEFDQVDPTNCLGANFKLLLPQHADALSHLDDFRNPNHFIVRTYTVRAFEPKTCRISVDFAMHDDNPGPAASWASQAKVGQQVGFAGPGPLKPLHPDAQWYLFAADMSGIAAAAAVIEGLPADAVGYAIFEITSEADKQILNFPAGIDVIWKVHAHPEKMSHQITETIKTLAWQDGTPGIFIVGEGTSLREVRQYLNEDKEIGKRDMYISPYWKIGLTEDQHQIQKRAEE